jgi:hypothetical protein
MIKAVSEEMEDVLDIDASMDYTHNYHGLKVIRYYVRYLFEGYSKILSVQELNYTEMPIEYIVYTSHSVLFGWIKKVTLCISKLAAISLGERGWIQRERPRTFVAASSLNRSFLT